jgi:hypothetical protein
MFGFCSGTVRVLGTSEHEHGTERYFTNKKNETYMSKNCFL